MLVATYPVSSMSFKWVGFCSQRLFVVFLYFSRTGKAPQNPKKQKNLNNKWDRCFLTPSCDYNIYFGPSTSFFYTGLGPNNTDKGSSRWIGGLGGWGGTHLVSLGFACTHLDSLGFIWTHLDSLGLT